MALRRTCNVLPRLLGSSSPAFSPLGVTGGSLSCLPSFAAQIDDDRSPSSTGAAPAQWRAYAAELQAMKHNPAVGELAQTDTGLPPVMHVRSNASHLVQYDEKNHERLPIGDVNKRAFTYFVLTGARFMYASAIRLVVLKFLLSWSASADVLAMAALEVDLNTVKEGQTVTVKWRGKPVFVKHRTAAEIARESAVPLSDLRDPQTDAERVTDPKWMVCLGVCTHLGCVPVSNAGDYHGWFCPCHGSHYDGSGRIRRGPAPYNLEVPEYRFQDAETLVIG